MKNWVVVSTRKGIRSEQQMTISLDGEESAVQEMSNDIRNNILDTPMAAAASSSSMAQSRQTETPSAAIPKRLLRFPVRFRKRRVLGSSQLCRGSQ